MRRPIKRFVGRTWKPFVTWYLRKPRVFRYRDISVTVKPGIFHPGFFFSTKLLLAFLEELPLTGMKFLEMGCGSGLVSIVAAKKGAVVTTVDISPDAIACTKQNAEANHVKITVLQSDLFASIPPQRFNIIAVNPPYYKKQPLTDAAHAWYCGENLDYFHGFFRQAKNFVHGTTRIIMVLSDECDLGGIRAIAANAGWLWETTVEKRTAWETGYIVTIRPANPELQ